MRRVILGLSIGTAVIPAPVDQVRGWLTDYANWPQLFSDISEARVEGRTPDGAAIVRFHSRIAQRTIVIRERVTAFDLAYEGGSTHVDVQGRIYLTDLGDGTTRVTMQSSSPRARLPAAVRHRRAETIARVHADALGPDLALSPQRREVVAAGSTSPATGSTTLLHVNATPPSVRH